ncbi:MAG: hypothetical protein A2066_20240 [Bacteroidetes bacterium GWB2_41_8]|nr:MAG: hypothetical protein A2066_20240 [Bacteroidetes bacterium GWB2_41_8]
MKSMKAFCMKTLSFAIWMFLPFIALSQESKFLLINKPWTASWITVPGTNPNGYGVYYFRKSFELNSVPEKFPVYFIG